MIRYKKSLHIFRRDLRTKDNTALINALESSEKVMTCFIFNESQLKNNPFKSEKALHFMAYSLIDLYEQLKRQKGKLYLFYGNYLEIIKKILLEKRINALYVNRDYTPFSRKRDREIMDLCQALNIDFHCFADCLLNEPEQVLKNNGDPYTVFSAYLRKAKSITVSEPIKNDYTNYCTEPCYFEEGREVLTSFTGGSNQKLFLKGGRTEAEALTKRLGNLTDYETTRNIPSQDGTSRLSAHLKFGTISVRELSDILKKKLGGSHLLINQLYWRDFFTHIAYHFPRVFGSSFRVKYDRINWSNNISFFRSWCEGVTGFPIVDAGMRQLRETGWMHNRIRMIVASFLVKDLNIDWRLGEKYFAQKLIDYDPSLNNGNWQWSASTGCDAQPWFRIFNPWLQQKKFDNKCLYIREWVGELREAPDVVIHNLFKAKNENLNYPRPIVNHLISAQKTKEIFSKSF